MQTLRARVHGKGAILEAHPHAHQTRTVVGVPQLRVRHRPETPLRIPPAEPHGRQAVHLPGLRLQVREQVDAPVAPQVALERISIPVLRLRVRVQIHAQPQAALEEARPPTGHAAQPGWHPEPGHCHRRGGQPARSSAKQKAEPSQSVSTTTPATAAADGVLVAGRRRQQQWRTSVAVLYATAVANAVFKCLLHDLGRVVHVLDDHQALHGDGRLPGRRIHGHQEQQQQQQHFVGGRQDGRTAAAPPPPPSPTATQPQSPPT